MQRPKFLLGLAELPGRYERQTSHMMPAALQKCVGRRWRRFLEDLLPMSESCQRPIRHHTEHGGKRHLLQHLIVYFGGNLLRRLDRNPALTIGSGRKPEKMNVMGIVRHRV